MSPRLRYVEVGERYGRLTVAKRRLPGEPLVECVCDCGNAKTVRLGDLGRDTNSCGCLRLGSDNPNWRGGKNSHPLYDIYNDMLGRCYRPTHQRYGDYGGRGITVCDRWREDFWAFVADMGDRPPGVLSDGRAAYSLDRIDNDRGYEPDNVRWADTLEQRHNQRRVLGAVS